MIHSFSPRMDILPQAQKQLWPRLARAAELGLVLYGGTAIALRLGHRFSVDFDFFTEKELDKDALKDVLPFITQASVLQESRNTYTVLVACGLSGNEYVKVSFLGGIGIGRIGEPALTEDGSLIVASLDDLMATKLKVILQRVEAKDYLDIAAMIVAGVRLDKGLAAARAMYGSNFQPSESLKAMVYFEGGDLQTLSTEARATLIEAASGIRAIPTVGPLIGELSIPH